jgi:glycosyltransferase involved in cell wall biosynthesis
MTYKLLWASPWNETSAIAKFGADVIAELAAVGFEVDVLRTELGDPLALPPLASAAVGQVHRPDDLSHAEVLNRYDQVILNLGNHYGFHGGGMRLLQECAPLVILHDAWMGHFLWSWQQAFGPEGWRVEGLIAELGGDPSGMTALCATASGAVVHGPHYLEQVRRACPGPVISAPLAFTFPPMTPPRLDGQRLVVATVGDVNSNKRADQVICAMGLSPLLRENASYVLAGRVQDRERDRLLALAERWNAPEPKFTGWIPEPELHALMEGVDVFCCLRDPCYEGGSASLVASLLSSRPTLVSDQAHYAELPDSVALKCVPGREAADVVRHLEWVLENPNEARALGQAAREFALDERSPRAYAERLASVLDASIAAAPMVRAASRLGRRLADIGIPPGDPATDRIAANLDGLLGAQSQSEL